MSYVRSATPTGATAVDGPGFFIQNDAQGPALFFELDPATAATDGAINAGDVLDIAVTAGDVESGITTVTAATLTHVGTGATLPAAQDISGDQTFNAPIPDGEWALESALVTASGVLQSGFVGAGAGFSKATLATTSTDGTSSVAFRIPADLEAAQGLGNGCTIDVNPVPMWRYTQTQELNVWSPADFTATCPAPEVVSTSPADGATNVSVTPTLSITFSLPMDPASIAAPSSGPCGGVVQLSADSFNTCAGLSSPTWSADGTTVSFSIGGQTFSFNTTFKLRVLASATSVNGQPMAADFTQTTGFTTKTSAASCQGSVVISQVYGGGGNGGATFTNDFIELHNRGSVDVDLSGWSVQYASASGTSWQVTPLSGTIAAGGFYLVQEAAGSGTSAALPTPDATGTINMSGSSGKVALSDSTVALSGGGCPAAAIDSVGFGKNTNANFCGTGTATTLTSSTAAERIDDGSGNLSCQDTDVTSADFTSAGAPAPRNSATAVSVCACASL